MNSLLLRHEFPDNFSPFSGWPFMKMAVFCAELNTISKIHQLSACFSCKITNNREYHTIQESGSHLTRPTARSLCVVRGKFQARGLAPNAWSKSDIRPPQPSTCNQSAWRGAFLVRLHSSSISGATRASSAYCSAVPMLQASSRRWPFGSKK